MSHALPPLLCATLVLTGCAFQPLAQTASALIGSEMSIERELEMTAEIHRQIRTQLPLVTDPVILAYLNSIGQELVRATEPQPYVYRFSLIRADELNAFTIGGGYVYLSSGVLAQASDVSELTGVLAHEIAHVHRRHIARRPEGQGLVTLATLAATAALVLAGGDPGLAAIPQGLNVALQLKHSRSNEAEADYEGIQYLIRAGYDPIGMLHFFETLLTEQVQGGRGAPAYLYSHPALAERIQASRSQIERSALPRGLRREDPRLPEMQARLAVALESVAGGSGLRTRAVFDRVASDPLIDDARAKYEAGDLDAADRLLAAAEKAQPADPRVALERAQLAEVRGDLAAARVHLERAFELDPSVPLVQYRLGRIHRRLGNRTRAVFYLEQAATNFKPGSSRRRRAELEIERLTFSPLDRSGLSGRDPGTAQRPFVRGEPVEWWGQLSRRFQSYNPEIRVEWVAPDGHVLHADKVRMTPLGRVSSTLHTAERLLPLGEWTVRVSLGDSVLEERSFHLIDALQSGTPET